MVLAIITIITPINSVPFGTIAAYITSAAVMYLTIIPVALCTVAASRAHTYIRAAITFCIEVFTFFTAVTVAILAVTALTIAVAI